MKMLLMVVFLISGVSLKADEEKSIRVFVALCDNATQGIVKVGEKIGNGDDPEGNLYWGCDDGLASYFKRSSKWKTVDAVKNPAPGILRRLKFRHADGGLVLTADAYRGAEMKKCLLDFEAAVASKEHALVAFIGHNGFMELQLPKPKPVENNPTATIALCCLSESYFTPRLERMSSEPLLLTRQLMYPGSFILHDAIESWRKGGNRTAIRSAAGRAYAKNQKISVRAGTGIFADLEAK
ncbi:conserved hypothetical protein [Haloferula helveola]|uniref:Uncharacterized protein n=1 Tax=Haloferula helveola TaxID=490095 RepID=A0ABN6H9F8_9BACT|nr:conserved hypothetical protein [Haloferula helveola]